MRSFRRRWSIIGCGRPRVNTSSPRSTSVCARLFQTSSSLRAPPDRRVGIDRREHCRREEAKPRSKRCRRCRGLGCISDSGSELRRVRRRLRRFALRRLSVGERRGESMPRLPAFAPRSRLPPSHGLRIDAEKTDHHRLAGGARPLEHALCDLRRGRLRDQDDDLCRRRRRPAPRCLAAS